MRTPYVARLGQSLSLMYQPTGRLMSILVLLCLGVSLAKEVRAADWGRWTLFKRVAAEPGESYPLTEDNSPWLVVASAFNGQNAAKDAQELAYELRSEFGIHAFTHARSFDYSERIISGIDRYGAPRSMRYRNDGQKREVAVLVDQGYRSVDDPKAQRMLRRLKYEVYPACLTGKAAEDKSQAFASLRELQKRFLPKNDRKRKRGPLGHAFVTTNPLLPPEYYSPKGVDRLVLEMNSDLKFSLLNCPGTYTVRVASFKGGGFLGQRKIDELDEKEPRHSRLVEAEMKAHELTLALRKLGWEAYEFHDLDSSMVTVGSFHQRGRVWENRVVQYTPEIQHIMATFGAEVGKYSDAELRFLRRLGKTMPATGLKPKTLQDVARVPVVNKKSKASSVEIIPFDIKPEVVEVPRRSIAMDYRDSAQR